MTYHELYALNRGSADYHGCPQFPVHHDYTVKIDPNTKEKFYVAHTFDPYNPTDQLFVKIKLV